METTFRVSADCPGAAWLTSAVVCAAPLRHSFSLVHRHRSTPRNSPFLTVPTAGGGAHCEQGRRIINLAPLAVAQNRHTGEAESALRIGLDQVSRQLCLQHEYQQRHGNAQNGQPKPLAKCCRVPMLLLASHYPLVILWIAVMEVCRIIQSHRIHLQFIADPTRSPPSAAAR